MDNAFTGKQISFLQRGKVLIPTSVTYGDTLSPRRRLLSALRRFPRDMENICTTMDSKGAISVMSESGNVGICPFSRLESPGSCCGTLRKLRLSKQARFPQTAATRSGRSSRPRRRSHRSPQSASLVTFLPKQESYPSGASSTNEYTPANKRLVKMWVTLRILILITR